jgi:hypothetical protein
VAPTAARTRTARAFGLVQSHVACVAIAIFRDALRHLARPTRYADFVTWVDSSKIKRAIAKYNDKLDDYDLLG